MDRRFAWLRKRHDILLGGLIVPACTFSNYGDAQELFLGSMMRVVFSIGARFAGGGSTGQVSYHAVRGLLEHELLELLLCGSYRVTEIPSEKIRSLGWPSRVARRLAIHDRSNLVDYLYRIVYDRWAARRLTGCDVFLGWSGYCIETIRRAKSLGAQVVLNCALAHPVFLDRLLQSELQRAGVSHKTLRAGRFVQREIAEADLILTPSGFVNASFSAEGVPDEKLRTIPFGVDTVRFVPTKGRVDGPFRALFVGQISVRKGAHALLRAWKQTGWSDSELWIVGKNRLPPDLAAPYRALPGIRFLGNVPDLVPLYQAVDVFVLPSLAEGSALVTYEAMACGLPTIVTPNAGSIAREDLECLMVTAGDSDAIARCLERLRSDEGLRGRMGAAARARVKEFTWERYSRGVAESLPALPGIKTAGS
jgi:glycosyltransferase involved in cell wall biosynthesis